MTAVAVIRAVVILTLLAGVLLGTGPWRAKLLAHPGWVLLVLAIHDVAYLVWATVPLVPNGIDEAQFLITAHSLLGADLPPSWIRPPLPVLAMTACLDAPALPGIFAKQIAMLGAFQLARPSLGPGLALVAALLTSVTSELLLNTCQCLSEPYGAAALVGFALACASRNGWLPIPVAALAFLSRWQSAWLLPVAAVLTVRRIGWVKTTALTLAAAGIIAAATSITGADPWRAFTQERMRPHSLWERLHYYFDLQCGLGLGPAALGLAVVGSCWVVKNAPRHRHLLVTALLFGAWTMGVLSMGVITRRFMAPAVPLGCVLVATGLQVIAGRWPAVAHGWRARVGLSILVLLSALPVAPPRSRATKLATPQAGLVTQRASFLAALGDAPLWTDVDVHAVAAILGRPCHAVVGPTAYHPAGEDLDFGGRCATVARDQLSPGSVYLTTEPAGRVPLWTAGQVSLVRW